MHSSLEIRASVDVFIERGNHRAQTCFMLVAGLLERFELRINNHCSSQRWEIFCLLVQICYFVIHDKFFYASASEVYWGVIRRYSWALVACSLSVHHMVPTVITTSIWFFQGRIWWTPDFSKSATMSLIFVVLIEETRWDFSGLLLYLVLTFTSPLKWTLIPVVIHDPFFWQRHHQVKMKVQFNTLVI